MNTLNIKVNIIKRLLMKKVFMKRFLFINKMDFLLILFYLLLKVKNKLFNQYLITTYKKLKKIKRKLENFLKIAYLADTSLVQT